MIIRNKFNGYGGDGRRLYPGGGGGGAPSQQTVTQTTIPEYARPYVERMLGKAEAFTDAPYQAYGGQRVADFSPMQQQAFQGIANLGPAQQLGTATQMAGLAGLRAGDAQYDPTQFSNTYNAPSSYQAGQFTPASLQQYQMQRPENVSTGKFTDPNAMQQYMSPYQQAVTDIEKREAERQSNRLGQQQTAQSIQRGAFGGIGQRLMEAERQRNLGQQMSDIQAKGGQAAFQQAAQQFQTDQQRALQAQLANQQMGFGTGQANLQAQLGVQQLGAGQNLEAQRLAEQSRQFGYGQDMTSAEAAARYGMTAQQAAEQSRQFGANYGMQGIQQQLAAAGMLGNLGQSQFGQQQAALQMQAGAGQQQQAQDQRGLDMAYQDFLSQRGHPQQQLAFMSDILRGGPLSQTTYQQYQAPPSFAAQLGGAGLTYLGARQAGLLAAKGGVVPGGLAAVAASKLRQG